jgi:spore coat protein JB
MSRETLTKKLQEVGFMLVELNLFLDTHPNDKKAIELYNTYSMQQAELRKEYAQKYGPLLNFGNQEVDDNFSWVNSPWPWEN